MLELINKSDNPAEMMFSAEYGIEVEAEYNSELEHWSVTLSHDYDDYHIFIYKEDYPLIQSCEDLWKAIKKEVLSKCRAIYPIMHHNYFLEEN